MRSLQRWLKRTIETDVRLTAAALSIGCAILTPASIATADIATIYLHADTTCVLRAIERLDDFRSDAATVATAVAPLCAGEWEMAMVALTLNKPPSEAASIRADWGRDRISLIAGFVLKNRALHRRSLN